MRDEAPVTQGEEEKPGRFGMPAVSRAHHPVGRSVILGDLEGKRLPQEGLVTAVRHEGLTIWTSAPFKAGERLFIEFPVAHPTEPRRTAIIRGNVSALRETGGECVLEVRLILMPNIPVTDVAASHLNAQEAAALIREVQNDLETAGDSGALPVADFTQLLPSPNTPARPRHRRRRVLAALEMLAAALLLVWLLPDATRFRPPDWRVRGLPGLPADRPRERAIPEEGNSYPGSGALGGEEEAFVALPAAAGAAVWQPGAWVRVEEPVVPDAPFAGTLPPEAVPLFSPVGWVMAVLRPLLAASDDSAALEHTPAFVVSEMVEPGDEPSGSGPATSWGEVPAQDENGEDSPYVEHPAHLPEGANPAPPRSALARLSRGSAETGSFAPNQPLVTVHESGGTGAGENPLAASGTRETVADNNAPERVRIDIEKSSHTLTIRFDGEPLAQFPVGLGRHNATPDGEFTIACKVTNPDWSDRGRIVKAGDPENPLGRRWIGLAAGGRATSYGIHPTSEPQSIGADMSRGCVRMRPEDAETVFRLCPVGTVVSIEP